MKTLKTILAGATLLFACVAANATVKKSHPSQTDVVKTYIADISDNKTDNIDDLFDTDMQFNLQRGQNVNTLNKIDLIQYLKSNTVVNEPLSTDTTVMAQDDNSAKIKIVFKYDGYTRTDIVTLIQSSGWRITNIDSSFS